MRIRIGCIYSTNEELATEIKRDKKMRKNINRQLQKIYKQ